MTLTIAVAALAGVGTWLLIRGGAVRLILGFILLGHAANLIIIAAGGTAQRDAPISGPNLDLSQAADPLPQAFVLTAIVITFGVTIYLLSLVARTESRPDDAASDDPAEPDDVDARSGGNP